MAEDVSVAGGARPSALLLEAAKIHAEENKAVVEAAKAKYAELPAAKKAVECAVLSSLLAIALKKAHYTPKEAARYISTLIGFAGRPGAEVRISVQTFVASYIENRTKTRPISDASLADEVKKVGAMKTEDERLQWIMSIRRQIKLDGKS